MAKKLLTALMVLFLFSVTCYADISNDTYFYTNGNTLSFGGVADGLEGLSNTDYKAIMAFYDEQGMLWAGTYSANAADSKLNPLQRNITLPRTPGNVTGKLMLWDGLGTCRPLTETFDIKQSIGIEADFALVDSTGSAIDETDLKVRKTLTVLQKENDGELATYFVDDSISIGNPARGTVVAITVKDNRIIEYKELFDKFTSGKERLTFNQTINYFGLPAGMNELGTAQHSFFRESGIPAWDHSVLSTTNGYVRVGFGMIVNKSGSTITLANRTGNEPTLYDENGNEMIYATETIELDYSDDVNVMVVDMSYKDARNSGRISQGTTVPKTARCKQTVAYATRTGSGTSDDPYVVSNSVENIWNLTNVENQAANYAYFKILNGKITDIIVYIPQA